MHLSQYDCSDWRNCWSHFPLASSAYPAIFWHLFYCVRLFPLERCFHFWNKESHSWIGWESKRVGNGSHVCGSKKMMHNVWEWCVLSWWNTHVWLVHIIGHFHHTCSWSHLKISQYNCSFTIWPHGTYSLRILLLTSENCPKLACFFLILVNLVTSVEIIVSKWYK